MAGAGEGEGEGEGAGEEAGEEAGDLDEALGEAAAGGRPRLRRAVVEVETDKEEARNTTKPNISIIRVRGDGVGCGMV